VVLLSPWRAAVVSDSPDPQLVLGFSVRKRAGAGQHAFLIAARAPGSGVDASSDQQVGAGVGLPPSAGAAMAAWQEGAGRAKILSQRAQLDSQLSSLTAASAQVTQRCISIWSRSADSAQAPCA
jgi:hypothetical protein